MDLNAELRELPGTDLAAELSTIIHSMAITHVTLIARTRSRLGLRRAPALQDLLLARHPHLDIHLVSAER